MENQNPITELLENESFLAWHYKTDPEQITVWENKMIAHPEIIINVNAAVALLNAIQIQEPDLPKKIIDKAENRLLMMMDKSSQIRKDSLALIDNQLNFDNAPMSEVKIKLEAVYGIKIAFADATIANEKITCMMPNDNLDLFIESLQATMVYQVFRIDNILTISRLSPSRLYKG